MDKYFPVFWLGAVTKPCCMSRKKTERRKKSAAIYVRQSTNHKRSSTRQQMVMTREFAKQKGFEIVKQFSDGGKIQTGSSAA